MYGVADAEVPATRERRGEDSVLLRELCHRAGNDLGVALAALRVIASGRFSDAAGRSRLVEQATARLEASAELHRLLARPVPDRVEAASYLAGVCAAAAGAGAAPTPDGLKLDAAELWLDGATARRLAMVASELVANAVKYASVGASGLRVSLRRAAGRVALRVMDDGPGIAPSAPAKGGGLGTGIVADLVALGGGRMSVSTGPGGTSVLVELPAGPSVGPERPLVQ